MSRFFITPPDWQTLTLVVGGVLLASLVAAEIGARLLRVILVRFARGDARATLTSPIVRTPIRLLRLTLFLLIAIALTPPALELAGARLRRGLRLEQVADWGTTHGLKILIIAVLAFVLVRTVGLMVRRFEHEVSQNISLEVLERA
ncbi:MAG: hypothetical protein H0X44_04385, partial [Acidobacteria bacterium]|nr:hypothetical protein [Acidobacteriota bacterium]